jgi:glycosyltransferase involved in cell wall biosynthesis
MLKIINIVDLVSEVNHGIWHAAIVNANLLQHHGYKVELWFPESSVNIPEGVEAVSLNDTKIETLKRLVKERQLDPAIHIIITHGLWQFPTRWGHYLKSLGFKWIYVPQGMLEPWPLRQKWLKKKIYFAIAERRMASKADLIRAVSKPELGNLRKFFPGSPIEFIPNGVQVPITFSVPEKQTGITNYLFLSRLHHKKNILALAEAWLNSSLNDRKETMLLIAGPDQGELEKLQVLVKGSSNIRYLGTVSGKDKIELFHKASFFVLPSFSEGLPSALLESMGSGLIPIISPGCNLPEVFTNGLGIEISTDVDSIKRGLEKSSELGKEECDQLSRENFQFIQKFFSVEAITAMQMHLYLSGKHYEISG